MEMSPIQTLSSFMKLSSLPDLTPWGDLPFAASLYLQVKLDFSPTWTLLPHVKNKQSFLLFIQLWSTLSCLQSLWSICPPILHKLLVTWQGNLLVGLSLVCTWRIVTHLLFIHSQFLTHVFTFQSVPFTVNDFHVSFNESIFSEWVLKCSHAFSHSSFHLFFHSFGVATLSYSFFSNFFWWPHGHCFPTHNGYCYLCIFLSW